MITGEMVYTAANETLQYIRKPWRDIKGTAQYDHMRVAQRLRVLVGESREDDLEFVYLGIDTNQADAFSDLLDLVSHIIEADKDNGEFTIYLIRNGQEVGKGEYEVCTAQIYDGIQPHKIGDWEEEYVEAEGLCQKINKELHLRTQVDTLKNVLGAGGYATHARTYDSVHGQWIDVMQYFSPFRCWYISKDRCKSFLRVDLWQELPQHGVDPEKPIWMKVEAE